MTNINPYGSVSTRVTALKYNNVPEEKSKESEDNTLEEQDVMTLSEVSEWLGIPEDDLKKMSRADLLPCFHPVKSHFYYSRRDLLAWLQENRRGRISKNTNTNNEDE